MRTSNKHNSLEELFSAIAEVIRCNLGHNQQLYTTDFSSAIVDDMYGCVDYRVKSIIDRSIEYITEEDLRSITRIKDYTFYNCTNLALTSLPEGITSIGTSAFYGCTNLALTSLPEGITSIGASAFRNCTNLALTSLPENLTSIDDYAFYYCTNLALTSLPESITSIGSSAFYYCMNLRTITFKGTPTSINSNAFGGCSNLATINVPWSEGEVAGAPWGATKATINYNYVGG